MRIILLLLTLYPLCSIAECDKLNTINHKIENPGSSALDIEYDKIIWGYVDKFDHTFRPESFFNLWSKRFSTEESKRDLHLRQMLIDNYNKMISGYLHFDDSIERSLKGLAQEKYTKAFYCLGFVYEKGIGKKVDYVQAWAWFYTASAVDGIYAKEHLTRVWQLLSIDEEIEAKRLADVYIDSYTNFTNTPSVTILK